MGAPLAWSSDRLTKNSYRCEIREGGNRRTPTWRGVHVSRPPGNTSDRQRCRVIRFLLPSTPLSLSLPLLLWRWFVLLLLLLRLLVTRRNFSLVFGSLSRYTESDISVVSELQNSIEGSSVKGNKNVWSNLGCGSRCGA
ncbi:hypothetical protein NL676_032639 [Syzygium grande]|nr:hypothetical protein NL676_032639 [Syzygium grande]